MSNIHTDGSRILFLATSMLNVWLDAMKKNTLIKIILLLPVFHLGMKFLFEYYRIGIHHPTYRIIFCRIADVFKVDYAYKWVKRIGQAPEAMIPANGFYSVN